MELLILAVSAALPLFFDSSSTFAEAAGHEISLVRPTVVCTKEEPCGECMGDCDKDSDCADGLVCFQKRGRANSEEEAMVPGCIGLDYSKTDWCIDEAHSPPKMDGPFWLQILHSSDNESSFQDPNSLEEKVIHYSSLVNGLQSQKDVCSQDPFETIHVTVGDHTIPGPFYLASAEVPSYGSPGVGDILIYNALGNRANGIGNHEFDGGIDDFATFLSFAEYPFLAANLDFSNVQLSEGTPEIKIAPDALDCDEIGGYVAKSCYVHLSNGQKVGLIGRSPAGLFNVVEDPATTIPGLDFFGGRDPETNQPLESAVPQVQEQVDLLAAGGANIIMLLDHAQDYTEDPLSANILTGVDIIIAAGSTGFMGQTSNFMAFNKLRDQTSFGAASVEASYPTVRTGSDGKPVLVINSDQLYFYIGTLMVQFDEDGDIVSWDGRSGPIGTTIEAVNELPPTPPGEIAEVREVLTNLQNTPSIQDAFLVIGETEFNLVGARFAIRTRESNLGRIVADSTIWGGERYASANGLPSIDVALKNGGGIRDDIVGPSIIRLTVQAALAFNNRLSIVELTTYQLLAAMENAVSRYPAADGRFPHVAGMTLVFDPSRPGVSGQESLTNSSRLESLVVTKADGTVEPIVEGFAVVGDPSSTFVMATNSFLLTGGDGYVSLAAGNAIGETDIGEQQILEEYIVDVLGASVSVDDPPPPPARVSLSALSAGGATL